MAWFVLVVAGVLEVAWAVGLKYTDGFTRFVPSLVTLVVSGLSLWLLAVAAKTLPIGTAYAVWVGIGALGTVLVGVAFFQEPMTLARGFFLAMLLTSIVGLKLTG